MMIDVAFQFLKIRVDREPRNLVREIQKVKLQEEPVVLNERLNL